MIDGMRYYIVTFALQNKYRLVGYINEQNLVERVQTWIDNDVMGDMPAEAWYTAYKDFGGVKFPATIVEKQAGFPVLILAVSDVKPNEPLTVQPQPARPYTASIAPVPVKSEKIADGVFLLSGGRHNSVALQLANQMTNLDAPLT